MLFDLRSGKRRRLVQVVYTLLALSFLIGFVIFGIGSNGVGGIGDLFSGGSSSGSDTSQYDSKIEAAQEDLAQNPKDADALVQLAENQYFKGRLGVEQDPQTGQFSVSSEAHEDLGAAADAWERYLKAVKGQPSASAATQMVNAYIYLNDAPGAAEAGTIVAEQKPSANSWGNVALFEYVAGDLSAGDAAADKALAETTGGSQRKQYSKQLDAYRKQAVKQLEAQKKAPKGQAETQLQNPFGSFGGATPPPSGG